MWAIKFLFFAFIFIVMSIITLYGIYAKHTVLSSIWIMLAVGLWLVYDCSQRVKEIRESNNCPK